MLTGDIGHHQDAATDRREQPYYGDGNETNLGARRSDFFFPADVCSLGKLMTFGEDVRRDELPNQLYAHEENQQVVQASDHRNEVRNELNGTEQISRGADCNQLGIPMHARMFEGEIEDLRLFLDSLRLSLPVHQGRGDRPDHVRYLCRITEVAVHVYFPSMFRSVQVRTPFRIRSRFRP